VTIAFGGGAGNGETDGRVGRWLSGVPGGVATSFALGFTACLNCYRLGVWEYRVDWRHERRDRVDTLYKRKAGEAWVG